MLAESNVEHRLYEGKFFFGDLVVGDDRTQKKTGVDGNAVEFVFGDLREFIQNFDALFRDYRVIGCGVEFFDFFTQFFKFKHKFPSVSIYNSPKPSLIPSKMMPTMTAMMQIYCESLSFSLRNMRDKTTDITQ